MPLKLLFLVLVATAYSSSLEPLSKATNDDPCEPCKPQGATGTTPPAVGSDLSSLYINVLQSVKGINFQNRSPYAIEARESGFCCRASLDCVNVQTLNIAMCYDKFTTNFAFADGSYGSLTTGEYSSGGNSANLISGDFTAGTQRGNIYTSNPQAKPNTATLSIPPQYTGTGVGSAVPANELGSILVYTTTIPGTTFTAPTTLAESVVVTTVSGQLVSTTIPAKTITQATTIAEQTAVVTTTRSATASAAASSTGAAGQVPFDSTRSIGMSILGALVYALYAL